MATRQASTGAASTPPQARFLGQVATPLRRSHRERVFDVAWSGDGRLLASACEGSEVRLWSVAAEEDNGGDSSSVRPPLSLLGEPLEHEAEVLRVAWRGRRVLASATATGRVRLYDVAAAASARKDVDARLATEWGHKGQGQVYALKWVGPRHPRQGEPGGGEEELMTAIDDRVFFWDVARGGGPAVAAKWEFSAMPGAESFGGSARNPDRTSYVFDAQVGCLHPQQGSAPVVCLALSDGSVRIHDRRTARTVATLRRSASAHLTALWCVFVLGKKRDGGMGVVLGKHTHRRQRRTHVTGLSLLLIPSPDDIHSLATEEGALVACGGRGEATVYDTRASFSVRSVLQGAFAFLFSICPSLPYSINPSTHTPISSSTLQTTNRPRPPLLRRAGRAPLRRQAPLPPPAPFFIVVAGARDGDRGRGRRRRRRDGRAPALPPHDLVLRQHPRAPRPLRPRARAPGPEHGRCRCLRRPAAAAARHAARGLPRLLRELQPGGFGGRAAARALGLGRRGGPPGAARAWP